MSNIGYKRIPEFIEEDFISAVETVLSTAVYPGSQIEISRISQDDERDLGYDGVLTSIVPFYIQFKRSTFHTPQFSGKSARDRRRCGYPSTRGFFSFALHRDRTSRRYDQHNKLFALAQAGPAAYVAPLFYKKAPLSRYKEYRVRYPWTYKSVRITPASLPRTPIVFDRVRVLHETMTFPPHALVLDRKPSHQYTYTLGGEICFHSKPMPVDYPRRTLFDFVVDVVDSLEKEPTQRFADGREIIHIIEKMFLPDLTDRLYDQLLRTHLEEFDIISSSWKGSPKAFIMERASAVERLLVAESILWNELRIVQYVARMRGPNHSILRTAA